MDWTKLKISVRRGDFEVAAKRKTSICMNLVHFEVLTGLVHIFFYQDDLLE